MFLHFKNCFDWHFDLFFNPEYKIMDNPNNLPQNAISTIHLQFLHTWLIANTQLLTKKLPKCHFTTDYVILTWPLKAGPNSNTHFEYL